MHTTRLVCGHCKVDVQEFVAGREGAGRCPHCGRAVDRRTVQERARAQRRTVGGPGRGAPPIGRETVVEF